mmetsp:Transcript_24567/g.92843  ORF Transcript_24567/g.92843 Transcript_24567/m.92843 type:complete len:356 (+) Transcript_24567:584-1651(+)
MAVRGRAAVEARGRPRGRKGRRGGWPSRGGSSAGSRSASCGGRLVRAPLRVRLCFCRLLLRLGELCCRGQPLPGPQHLLLLLLRRPNLPVGLKRQQLQPVLTLAAACAPAATTDLFQVQVEPCVVRVPGAWAARLRPGHASMARCRAGVRLSRGGGSLQRGLGSRGVVGRETTANVPAPAVRRHGCRGAPRRLFRLRVCSRRGLARPLARAAAEARRHGSRPRHRQARDDVDFNVRNGDAGWLARGGWQVLEPGGGGNHALGAQVAALPLVHEVDDGLEAKLAEAANLRQRRLRGERHVAGQLHEGGLRLGRKRSRGLGREAAQLLGQLAALVENGASALVADVLLVQERLRHGP